MKSICIFIILIFSEAALLAVPQAAIKKDSIQTDSVIERFKSYQYSFYNHFSINPAYAGVEECHSLSFGMDKPMVENSMFNRASNFAAAGDFIFSKKIKIALGVEFNYNTEGPFTSSQAGISLSYPFFYKEHHIRLGVGAKYVHQQCNFLQLTTADRISNNYGFIYSSQEVKPDDNFNLFDLNCGFWYNWKGLFAGFAVNNMISHDYNFFGPYQRLLRTYNIETGYDWNLYKIIVFTPAIHINKESGRKLILATSASFSLYKKIFISICYQNFNTLNFYFGISLIREIFIYGSAGVSTNKYLYEISPLNSFEAGLKFGLKITIMKKTLLAAIIILLFSCTKEKTIPHNGNIFIRFNRNIDTCICEGDIVELDATSDSADSYNWISFENNLDYPNIPVRKVTGEESGQVTIKRGVSTIGVYSYNIFYYRLFCSNSFSPDGDDLNDTWKPEPYLNRIPKKYLLKIFDNRNNESFSTNDITRGWDGKINGHQPVPGFYYYCIKYTSPCGEEKTLTGTIQLILP